MGSSGYKGNKSSVELGNDTKLCLTYIDENIPELTPTPKVSKNTEEVQKKMVP